jgi:hypothetical protein
VWGEDFGASHDKCDETYCGVKANSEPETLAEVNYMKKAATQGRIICTMSMHTYSQDMLYSYGYKFGVPPNGPDLKACAQAFVNAVQEHSGTKYTEGGAADLLYRTSGASDDYYQAKMGILYNFTPELRDTGKLGFILPARDIMPTANETVAGFYSMFKWMAIRHNVFRSGSPGSSTIVKKGKKLKANPQKSGNQRQASLPSQQKSVSARQADQVDRSSNDKLTRQESVESRKSSSSSNIKLFQMLLRNWTKVMSQRQKQ